MAKLQPLQFARSNWAPSQEIELSVIVPTFNERDNVSELHDRLASTLEQICWEVIFVDDDSPDGTAQLVHQLGSKNPRIRCIHRIGRRGLSSACIEGMLASSAPYLAVMDADLQHDEALLVPMLECLKKDKTDVVIGSRYIEGGGVGQWEERRAGFSRLATRLSKLVLEADVKDPMSGFFVIRRDAFEQTVRNLSGVGFKILLDLLASSPQPLRSKELPYQFRNRQKGQSKLDSRAAWDYFVLVLDKCIGHIVPMRFVNFALVGSLGVLVHLLVLFLTFKVLGIGFVTSQSASTAVAMTINFVLNNILTYRDMRLTGWRWLYGWLTFTLACSVGAVANVSVAAYLFRKGMYWLASALAGIIVSSVWNYAITSVYTWNKPREVRNHKRVKRAIWNFIAGRGGSGENSG